MFLAFRQEVESVLTTVLDEHGYETADLGIEEPPGNVEAMLASSVAFRLAETANQPPPAIAADLAADIPTEALEYIGDISSQGPYVNFSPSDRYYQETLEAAQATTYGQLPDRDESVIVEHTSANPTGPIHVGRARNPIIGDAIARLLAFAGFDVEAHYYVNDAGRQIAVFTWAYETFDEDDLPAPERDRIEYDLVRYYRKGNEYLSAADPDAVEAAESEISAIMQGLERGEESTYARVGEVVDQVLRGMRECLSRLPARFDDFVKETRFMRDNTVADVVRRLEALPEAYEEENGALALDFSDAGIEKELVVQRADGTSLYPTRDIAHHEWKLDTADRAVTVLGEDHRLQAAQLTEALELLGWETDRLEQVFYSWVNLPEGGMSTREGTGVNLDDLLDEAIQRAREEVEQRLDTRLRDDELGEADIDRIARQVGIGAVRYDIVSKQPTKGITFRWEEALDFEAQSAPYVQYVHARCCGILAEAQETPETIDTDALSNAAAWELLDEIARFPAVVDDAAADLTPHAVATYTRDLAEVFNTFYRECPVIDAEPATRQARLGLVIATRNAMANALEILGVEAPDSM